MSGHSLWINPPGLGGLPSGLEVPLVLVRSGLGGLLVLAGSGLVVAGSDLGILLVLVLSGPEVLIDLEQKELESAGIWRWYCLRLHWSAVTKQLDPLLLAYVESRGFPLERLVGNQQGVRNLLVPSYLFEAWFVGVLL